MPLNHVPCTQIPLNHHILASKMVTKSLFRTSSYIMCIPQLFPMPSVLTPLFRMTILNLHSALVLALQVLVRAECECTANKNNSVQRNARGAVGGGSGRAAGCVSLGLGVAILVSCVSNYSKTMPHFRLIDTVRCIRD